MSPLPVNEKSHSVIKRTSKAFSLIIANFADANTWFFRLRERIRITFNSKVISKFSLLLSIKRVRLIISQVKMTIKPTILISAKRVRLILSSKAIYKFLVTYQVRIRQTYVSKAIQKVVSTIVIKKIRVLISPTLATFFTLGVYDPTTLGTQDTKTLGQMDYTA